MLVMEYNKKLQTADGEKCRLLLLRMLVKLVNSTRKFTNASFQKRGYLRIWYHTNLSVYTNVQFIKLSLQITHPKWIKTASPESTQGQVR